MGEFIYIVDIMASSFRISKNAQIAFDDQELARAELRKYMEEFKARYTPYIDKEGWQDDGFGPDDVDITAYGENASFHFFGTIKELFVHGKGARLISYSGGIVRSVDHPDVMCAIGNTLVSYNDMAVTPNLREAIDVETQTEVHDLDFGGEGTPNGFDTATPEDEQRYSAAREAIRERRRNK